MPALKMGVKSGNSLSNMGEKVLQQLFIGMCWDAMVGHILCKIHCITTKN